MSQVDVGYQIPMSTYSPSEVDLFMFSASSWLLHRIHYDRTFTVEHDGHPDLLIHGPLQGVYLVRTTESWMGGRGRLDSIAYRHLAPAYLGDTLECGGSVTASSESGLILDLFAQKSDGTVTTRGEAKVTWH